MKPTIKYKNIYKYSFTHIDKLYIFLHVDKNYIPITQHILNNGIHANLLPIWPCCFNRRIFIFDA